MGGCLWAGRRGGRAWEGVQVGAGRVVVVGSMMPLSRCVCVCSWNASMCLQGERMLCAPMCGYSLRGLGSVVQHDIFRLITERLHRNLIAFAVIN